MISATMVVTRRITRQHLAVALAVLALWGASPAAAQSFRRGEVDGDGTLTVSDGIAVLRFLFSPEVASLPCLDAADADDDGAVRMADALLVLRYLFLRGPAPAVPFPACGADPTADDLACERFDACSAGDVFVFVIDRSGSFTAGGGLAVAKREVVRNIKAFSASVEFAVIFSDRGIRRFPTGPVKDGGLVPATAENKAAAVTFIESVFAGGGSCPRQALLLALDIALPSAALRKSVTYYGDGGGTCQGQSEAQYLQETLDLVAERNQMAARVNSVGVGNITGIHRDFLIQLAARNGGTFTIIAR